jgi:hypothetical protein
VLQISHPSRNPDLPSFIHPAQREVEKDLERAADCWALLKDCKDSYLPREIREPLAAYKGRVERSTYASFYRDAIVAFAGVLSRFELRDPPASVVEYQTAIDADGNSLKAHLMTADAWVLRDGGCLLTVDLPPAREESRAEQRQAGRRAYLAQVERRNVLNWRTARVGGVERCVACTILEWAEEEDGDYGTKLVPQYRVMAGGRWRLLQIEEGNGRGDYALQVIDEGEFLDANGTPLAYPPVVWYGSTREGFGRGQLPLLSLAELSLDWFREYSDLSELLHKTALPVAVMKGMDAGKPLSIGPNSVLGITDPNGSFQFVEVAGSSLAAHQQHLTHIEGLIDRQTLSFLFGGGNRTATQSLLESAQLQATLTSLSEAKDSAISTLFEIWCAFTGDEIIPGSGIDMAQGVFDQPVGPEQLTIAQNLYNSSLISRASLLALERKAGLLRPGVTDEEEEAAIQETEPTFSGGAPAPGVNDLAGDNGLPIG